MIALGVSHELESFSRKSATSSRYDIEAIIGAAHGGLRKKDERELLVSAIGIPPFGFQKLKSQFAR